MHRLTATDTPMVRYTRTIFPSYAETLIEFYHTENIVDNKVIHEYDYVDEVQLVTVKVHYQLFTLTNTYELLVVD